MSSSIPRRKKLTFLLDENVRVELDSFLESGKIEFRREPAGTPDAELVALSKKEKYILVTNDRGFSRLPKEKIFAVVWLRIPQKDLSVLLASFQKLLTECRNFGGKLIILSPNKWEDFALPVLVAVPRTK